MPLRQIRLQRYNFFLTYTKKSALLMQIFLLSAIGYTPLASILVFSVESSLSSLAGSLDSGILLLVMHGDT